jgi:hypothetical protein
MSRSCRVTIRDLEGIEHTAEVTAESLYGDCARAAGDPPMQLG